MSEAAESVRNDEQRIARLVSLGLPAATIAGAMVVGFTFGAATSILVVAAGLLLGVIALLWASLRILSGDAPLSPEIEALDMSEGGDALLSRKKMLLRALKDLENERAIGKIEKDDFDQVAQTYRDELKTVFKLIDETLEPHRGLAEQAVRAHLDAAGLNEESAPKKKKAKKAAPKPSEEVVEDKGSDDGLVRVACPKCGASNERDAKFCKECATGLKESAAAVPAAEEVDDAQ